MWTQLDKNTQEYTPHGLDLKVRVEELGFRRYRSTLHGYWNQCYRQEQQEYVALDRDQANLGALSWARKLLREWMRQEGVR